MVDTFGRVLGAYLHYSDEPPPETVQKWNVVTVPIKREARHLDKTAQLDFFKALDAFLAARRSELEY